MFGLGLDTRQHSLGLYLEISRRDLGLELEFLNNKTDINSP